MNNETLLQQASAILNPLNQWVNKCHQASLTLVKAGVGTRVARGFCSGVPSQHSWVIMGNDCYDPNATIIDPTLCLYRTDVQEVWIGSMHQKWHTPHGLGSIWTSNKPRSAGGIPICLNTKNMSKEAQCFLQEIEPLDIQGWHQLLAKCPVQGWPSKEIITEACNHPTLKPLIPIDIVGMLTNLNPNGLYLK